jgi:hypothetical protein
MRTVSLISVFLAISLILVSINPVMACDKPKTWRKKTGEIVRDTAIVVFGGPFYILMLPLNLLIIASYNTPSRKKNKQEETKLIRPIPCSSEEL